MRETVHVIFSFLLGVVLFPFVGWNALLVFLAASLLDIDHFLWYYLEFREVSFRKCRALVQKLGKQRKIKQYRYLLSVFHTWELVLALAALSIVFGWAFYLFSGVAFHLLLDTIDRLRFSRQPGLYSAVLFMAQRRRSAHRLPKTF